MTNSAVLPRLAASLSITDPVALVCAHPDDELIGLGSRLHVFARLTLIHVTDGAPLDMADARREGFPTRDAYAAARQAESAEGLARLRASPVRRVWLDIPDQTAIDRLPELTTALARAIEGQAVVFTHAYEGAHPDHDACAVAVQIACSRLEPAPLRLEFAGYYSASGVRHANAFHPDAEHAETAVELTPQERARKLDAYAAHVTQRETLALFPPEREAWRVAPTYDFTRPPPNGQALYDSYGWALTSAIWRERAAALKKLQP